MGLENGTKALFELPAEDTGGFDQIESMARSGRSLEDAGRRFGSPKPYEDLQDEFRAQMEKYLKEKLVSIGLLPTVTVDI